MFKRRARRVKSHSAHRDWAELGKLDPTVATDRQRIRRCFVAIKLNIERVARSHDVVNWNLNILDRRKRARYALEQVVAKRLGAFIVQRLEPQKRQLDRE